MIKISTNLGGDNLRNSMVNFIKGILIGIGGVLPGLSGGALAAILGLYEPLIRFASNMKRDFKKNVHFFLPVVIGGIFGVFALSHLLSYLLEYNLVEISLFFVGCMLGVFPALVKQAGARGRKKGHVLLVIGVALISFFGLTTLTQTTQVAGHASFVSWILSGGIIGLGITFPGLSPSNFLMYLGLYQPLNEAISQVDFSVLTPVIIGVVTTFLLTAKLVAYLLRIAYATVFHIIIGLVITSTVMIVPRDFTLSWMTVLCLIAGLCVGGLMSRLENQ